VQELHATPPPLARWKELATTPLVRRSLLWLPGLAAIAAAVPAPGARWALAVPLFVLFSAWTVLLARHAAEQRTGPLKLGSLFEIEGLEYGLQTFWFALPFAALFALAAATGSLALNIVALAITAALAPAALMATVMSDHASGMLQPQRIRQLLVHTRRDYLPVALLGLSATGLLAFALQLPGTSPWKIAGSVVAGLAGGWLLTAWGRAVGELLYRHRRMLDYPAGVDSLDRPRRPNERVYRPALMVSDAQIMLVEGRKKAARRYLGECLTRFPDDLELNRQFDELVRESSSRPEYRNHLERRLRRLVGRGQSAGAADIWERNNAYLGNWTPKSSETRYRLALELDQRGEHAVAFRMLIGLSPKNAGFNHLAEAWLEAARILDQHLGDPDKAADLRHFVGENYPERARKWLKKWQAYHQPRSSRRTRAGNAGARAGAGAG
jgi:hypothetical protein